MATISTSAPFITLNETGEVTGINDAFERLLGYAAADLVGMPRMPFLSVDDEEILRGAVRQAFRGDPPEPLDLPATCSANTTRDLHWSAVLLRDEADPGRSTVAVFAGGAGGRPKLREKSILGDIEDLYRAIFDNSGVGLLFTDVKTTIVLANREFEKATGYTREETEGKMSWTALIARPEDLERMKSYTRLRRIDPGYAPAAYTTKIRTRSGEVRDMLLRVTMIPGTGNSLVSFVDITERRLAEETIRESEEMLRGITKNIPGTIFQFYVKDSGEYAMSYVSERLTELLGVEGEPDALFPTFLSLIHGDDRDRLLASIRKAVESSSPWRFEGRLCVPSSGEMWFQGVATPRRQGDRLVYDGILLDITARKRAEEALEKRMVALTRPLDDAAEIAFEELFNIAEIQRLQDDFARATGVASIITRTDGTPITMPSCFCRLCIDIIRKTEKGLANCYKSDAELGRLSREGPTVRQCMSGGLWDAGAGISVGGRHIANWLIGQVRDETQTEGKMREYAREIGADEEEFVLAFRQVPAMSRERFDRVSRALYTLANQLSTLAYQNVQQARFITERRKSEEERMKLEEQLFLSEKMKAIGQLAGGIAHDFNNILMGILGNASLVQMEFDPGHPCYKRLGQIEEHVKRGANLTRQLLGFAREGKYEVKVLSVNDLIRKSAQLYLETRKGIEAAFLLREDVFPVEADAGQIEQVLLNILINAGHAMPRGGSLDIRTSNVTLSESDAKAS